MDLRSLAKVAPGDILQVGAPMLAVRERDDEDALRAHSAALTPTQPRGVCHVAKLLGAKPAEVGNGAELIYEVENVEGKLPQGEGRFGVGVHNGHRDLAQFRSNRGADPRATGRRTIIYRCVYKPSLKRTATRTSAACRLRSVGKTAVQ